MTENVLAELKRMIAMDLDVNLKIEDIDETVPLLEEGLGFDSLVIVEFISLIEDRFGFEFEDSDLDVDTFKNLEVLAGVIEQKLMHKAA